MIAKKIETVENPYIDQVDSGKCHEEIDCVMPTSQNKRTEGFSVMQMASSYVREFADQKLQTVPHTLH